MRKLVAGAVTAAAIVAAVTVAGCGLGGTTTTVIREIPVAAKTATPTPTKAKPAPTVTKTTAAPVNVNQNNVNNPAPGGGAAPAPVAAPTSDNCGFVAIPVPCSSAPAAAPVLPAVATPPGYTGGPCGCAGPVSPSSTSAAGAYDPWTVMQEYYNDLDLSGFQAAWNMQAPSFQAANGGYASWVAGYAHTGMNHIYEVSESGDTVNLTLVARDTTTQEFQDFSCVYTVDTTSGLITAGSCT